MTSHDLLSTASFVLLIAYGVAWAREVYGRTGDPSADKMSDSPDSLQNCDLAGTVPAQKTSQAHTRECPDDTVLEGASSGGGDNSAPGEVANLVRIIGQDGEPIPAAQFCYPTEDNA